MSVTSTAHLNFRGDARQAMEFYHSVFGGQLMIATTGSSASSRTTRMAAPRRSAR